MILQPELVQHYGYWAILIGTAFEGETILVMGGFAAHSGYLSLPTVVLFAFCGAVAGDQTMFWIGRVYGRRVADRWPRLARRIEQARPLVDRFGKPLVLAFRFLYGLRVVTPVAMAMSGFSPRVFVALDLVAAAVWAAVVASLGYLFGHGLELLLARAQRYEAPALVSIACAGLIVWVVHLVRRRRSRAHGSPPRARTCGSPGRD